MVSRVDLNADVGESFGAYVLGQDQALMPVITSASVACGFHAGDPGVMRTTVRLAREHRVAVGAHPGFPDLAGFGRRDMQIAPGQVEDLVAYQIGALSAIAAAEGMVLRHVKPHGALYNMAARDRALAAAVARAVVTVDRTLALFALAGSALLQAGMEAGLTTVSEVFADRAYRADGSLLPRSEPGAVVHDEAAVVARALGMVRDQAVTAVDGTHVPIRAETICVHGDTPDAPRLARRLRDALEDVGFEVAAPRRLERP
jgi:UPF0271 protein